MATQSTMPENAKISEADSSAETSNPKKKIFIDKNQKSIPIEWDPKTRDLVYLKSLIRCLCEIPTDISFILKDSDGDTIAISHHLPAGETFKLEILDESAIQEIQYKNIYGQSLQPKKKGKKHICKYCNRSFNESSNLKTHMRIHTGERPFVCDFPGCGKRFITKGHLKSHQFIHSGEKPFACDFPGCNKRYSRSGRLLIHKRTHTGDKPFVCNWPGCGKTFTEKGNLKTHMRIHTGEKPYKCDFEGCGKTFTTQGHLTDHKRRHTGERPFKCNICNQSFMRSSTLTIHMRRHTGERPYKCDVCGKAFSESGNLKTHKKLHIRRGELNPDGTPIVQHVIKRAKTEGSSLQSSSGISGSAATVTSGAGGGAMATKAPLRLPLHRAGAGSSTGTNGSATVTSSMALPSSSSGGGPTAVSAAATTASAAAKPKTPLSIPLRNIASTPSGGNTVASGGFSSAFMAAPGSMGMGGSVATPTHFESGTPMMTGVPGFISPVNEDFQKFNFMNSYMSGKNGFRPNFGGTPMGSVMSGRGGSPTKAFMYDRDFGDYTREYANTANSTVPGAPGNGVKMNGNNNNSSGLMRSLRPIPNSEENDSHQ